MQKFYFKIFTETSFRKRRRKRTERPSNRILHVEAAHPPAPALHAPARSPVSRRPHAAAGRPGGGHLRSSRPSSLRPPPLPLLAPSSGPAASASHLRPSVVCPSSSGPDGQGRHAAGRWSAARAGYRSDEHGSRYPWACEYWFRVFAEFFLGACPPLLRL